MKAEPDLGSFNHRNRDVASAANVSFDGPQRGMKVTPLTSAMGRPPNFAKSAFCALKTSDINPCHPCPSFNAACYRCVKCSINSVANGRSFNDFRRSLVSQNTFSFGAPGHTWAGRVSKARISGASSLDAPSATASSLVSAQSNPQMLAER